MTKDPASLDNLRDLALPAPIPWWPPAIGWWIVAAAALLAMLAWLLRRLARYRADAYRRAALRELDAVETMIAAEGDTASTAAAISTLLKRVALTGFSREEVASLSGDGFLSFLDRTGGTATFSQGPGRELMQLACGGARCDAAKLHEIATQARDWIRNHGAPLREQVG